MANPLRSFRLSCPPGDDPLVEALLRAQGFEFEPEPFHPRTRALVHEPFALGGSLAAFFGLIYIQDPSSMLPPLALAPDPGSAVLDMCAAPGSKTGFLAQLVGPDGFVLGCEPSADRLATLRANLRRTGAANTATAKGESQSLPLPDNNWRAIQLDPPCSGWGTVDKNPKVMELWADEKTAPLIALQKTLLARAADLLAPGGRVLYSTCTTNVRENEEQVRWALETLGLELEPLSPPPGFTFDAPALPGMDGVLRVAEASRGQGFFLARFRKPGDPAPISAHPAQPLSLPGQPLNLKKMSGTRGLDLSGLPPGQAYDFGGKVFFLHRLALETLPPDLRWQGYLLGRLVGRDKDVKFRPQPACRLLMPPAGGKDAEALDVDEPEVIERLITGQSLDFARGAGPVGLYFRGLRLAWLTRKGGRVLWSDK